MEVNKRSSVRMALELGVDVFSCGTYLARTTTRDIHLDGAFIRCNSDEIFQNDMLELYFITDDEVSKPVYLRGMVVRSSEDGIGVLFGYSDIAFKWLLTTFCENIDTATMHEVVRASYTGR